MKLLFPAKLFRPLWGMRQGWPSVSRSPMLAAVGIRTLSAKTTHHVVDDAHRLAEGGCLETHVCKTCQQLFDSDAAMGIVIEVYALDLSGAIWHGRGWLQYRISGARGSLRNRILIG